MKKQERVVSVKQTNMETIRIDVFPSTVKCKKSLDFKLTYQTPLDNGKNLDDIINRATLHAIGMIRDSNEMLDEEKFDGTRKLQIIIQVVDK